MENLLKNELFTHVSAEELEKMIPCFEMTKRSFREKDIIPTHEGGKNYICLLLSGTVSVNRISIDGSSATYWNIWRIRAYSGQRLPLPIRRMRF